MNHKQQIDLLNTIMPDIVSTKQPEKVMLKCAKQHNLAPAQLEKLAQVYNTAKTLVGLEKQANRGDAFTIVNVPELVSSYTTYDPKEHLSAVSKSVHRKVDNLAKSASIKDPDGWLKGTSNSMQKSASAKSGELPNLLAIRHGVENIPVVKDTTWSRWQPTKPADFDILHKTAYTRTTAEAKFFSSVEHDLRVAKEDAEQAEYESGVELNKLAHTIAQKVRGNADVWPEMVEDMVDMMGAKSASVVNMMEDFFVAKNIKATVVDLTKRAFVRPLAFDRHNIVDTAVDICDAMTVRNKAKEIVQALTKQADEINPYTDRKSEMIGQLQKEMRNSFSEALTEKPVLDFSGAREDTMNKLVDGIQNLRPGSNSHQRALDDAESKVKAETTLQRLMLEDATIRDADPHAVNDIYQTIYSLSPTYASDPLKLAPVMKEALQYDAVPMHIMKELIQQEGGVLDNEEARRRAQRDIYSLGGGPKK